MSNHESPTADVLPTVDVLLVEDSLTDALFLRRWLKQSATPFDLQVIRDGEEACRHLAQPADTRPLYRLILLDLHLPGQNGDQLARLIRSLPQFDRTSVILFVENPNDAGWQQLDRVVCRAKPRNAQGYDALVATIQRLMKDDSR